MSTSVKIGLGLLASKGILPKEEMILVFKDCLSELGFEYKNSILSSKGLRIGKISIKDRIILNMERQAARNHLEDLEKIRSLFALRASIAQRNYVSKRKQEIKKSLHNKEVYQRLLQDLETEENIMVSALKRQKLDSCEALKQELIEAAKNNGFEVEEVNTQSNQVQLQLLRREY